MTPQTAHLFLPEDLEGAEAPGDLSTADRDALRSVSEWVKSFVARPHKDLGRDGSVCPFVPGSLERRVLWFAPEHVANADTSAVAELMEGYKRFFLDMAPIEDEDAIYKTIIVTFTDLPAERAGALFTDVLGQIAEAAYVEEGIIYGPFFEGNPGQSIHNPDFRPFQSPVPFIFVRHTVLEDWKFFVDDDDALDRWARRFGPAGAVTLGKELRQLPWRERAGGRGR